MKKLLWIAPAALAGIALFIFVGGEVVKLLWNWLAPVLFGWRLINFWQAIGLLAICRILFGHHGGPRFGRSNFRRRWRERWDRMTPEERERFRQRMGRCGPSGPAEPNPTPPPVG